MGIGEAMLISVTVDLEKEQVDDIYAFMFERKIKFFSEGMRLYLEHLKRGK